MKTMRMMIMLFAVVLTANALEAQTFVKKELKTENNERDGFQYQWYKYTYTSGEDTYEAAFDLNGKRITPNGYKRRKNQEGVFYNGGGMFSVYSKKKDSQGFSLCSGYNTNGDCVFLEKYIGMYYLGDGLFVLRSHNESGKQVVGLYSYSGRCIISESKNFGSFEILSNAVILATSNTQPYIDAVYSISGNCIISETLCYNYILYYEESNVFVCTKGSSMSNPDVEHTISRDGKYYAEGFYGSDGENYKGEKFEKNKKPVSTLSGGAYASTTTTTTSSGGSGSSGSSSGSDKGKLLYEGMYIGGPSLLNGMSSPDVMGSVKVEIYENEIHIDCGGGSYYFSGINNGKRKYSIYSNGGKVFADVVVDNSYNLTLYRYHPIGTETKQYTRADSSPVNIPQGGYYGGGDNYGGYNSGSSGTNGGNSGNTQTSQPKQHKCGFCGGSGRVVKSDGPSFGNTKYCSECGKTVPDNHYHITCPSCNGKGWW